MPLHKFVAAFACGKACCGCFHLSGINICATHFLITPPLFFPPCCKECGRHLHPFLHIIEPWY